MTQEASTDELMESQTEFITVSIGPQLFGIPVNMVHDVFVPQSITSVPLSSREVAGVLNLRGRVVTAIDVRQCLGLPPRDSSKPGMAVGIDENGEAYGLVIDGVGEVLKLDSSSREQNPSNLDPRWRRVSGGVYRLDGSLLVVLDVEKLLEFGKLGEAA